MVKTIFVVERFQYDWIPSGSASGQRFEFESYHEAYNFLSSSSQHNLESSYRIVKETRTRESVYALMGVDDTVRNIESANAPQSQPSDTPDKSGNDKKKSG